MKFTKTNLRSALLVVLMVLSMLAVIALPAAAEGPTEEELAAMPRASEAYKNDAVKFYKIDSVDELIAAASAEFVGAKVSVSTDSLASVGATNNIHEKFYDTGFDRGDLSTYDTIYLAADLDIAAWQAANPDKDFGALYDGFNANAYYYTTPSFVLDGLGHTIKGYEDTEAFIAGNALGAIKNLKMVDCHVDAAPRSAYSPAVVCKGAEIGGVRFENVHLENCSLVSPVSGCGLFIAYPNKAARNVGFLNCSLVNSSVECTAAGAFGVGLFSGRWGGNVFAAENCVAANSTVTVTDPVTTTTGNALLFGHINSGQKPTVTIKNVASINNTMVAPVMSAMGIISTIGNAASGTVTATHNYAAGNVYKNSSFGDEVPMENLYVNTNNKIGTTTITDTITNAEVTMLLSKSSSGTTVANTAGVAGYNAGSCVLALNKNTTFDWAFDQKGNVVPYTTGLLPVAVTFGGVPFATDIVGKLVLDVKDEAFLKSANWTDGETAYEDGFDWAGQRFYEITTFTAKETAPFYVRFDKTAYAPGDVGTATVGVHAGSNLAALNAMVFADASVLNLVEQSFTYVSDQVAGAEARPVDGALEIALAESAGSNLTAATDLFTVQFIVRGAMHEDKSPYIAIDVKIYGTETGSGLSDIASSYDDTTVKGYLPVETDAYVQNGTKADELPSVMTAYANDGVSAYKISSWEELIWAAAEERYANGYKAFGAVSGKYKASSYCNPVFIDSDTFVRGDSSTYNTLYLTTDLDVADYPGGAAAFAADFDNFNGGSKKTSFWATTVANFDGLGHTITGYQDSNCFAAYWTGTFKNITFVDPVVNTSLGYDAIVLHGVEEGGVVMSNVHVIGGSYTSSAQTAGGILVGMASNGNRCLKMYNCSVVNTTLSATYDGSLYGGLVAGLIASPASGFPADTVTFENIVVSGCTYNAKNLSSNNSLLFGRIDKSDGTLGLVFDRVAVFDSHVISQTASNVGATFAAVANIRSINSSATIDVGEIYAGNVTGKSGSENAAPLSALFYDQKGTFAAKAAVIDGNYVTDGSITVAVSNSAAINVKEENQMAGLTLEQALPMMTAGWNLTAGKLTPLGHKITFNRIDPNATTNTYAGTYEFYTDPNTGRLAFQPNGEAITYQQWAIINSAWMTAADATEYYVNGELEWVTFEQDTQLYQMPLASRATRNDDIAVYQINSVAELIKTNMQIRARRYDEGISGERGYMVWNFLPTDTVLITADLDMADWDYTGLATYTEGVGYTPTYLGYVGNNTEDYRSPYNSKSGDTTTYIGYKENTEGTSFATMQELAANLYNGLAQGYRAGRNYNILNCTVDGLNHTVRNFKDNHSFVWGTILGKICNLTFDNAQVDARHTTYDTSKWTSQAIITNGSNVLSIADGAMDDAEYCLIMDNLHIVNSRCNSVSNVNMGMFVDWISDPARTISITNSSVGNSVIDCKGTGTSSYVGLFAGYLNTTTNMENVVAYNSTIAVVSEHSTAPSVSFIVGSHHDKTKTLTYNNVAAVDCTLLASSATTGTSSILGNFNSSSTAVTTMTIDNVFATGNRYGVGTLDTMDSATLTAMPKMFVARSANAISTSALTLGTATADANVAYFVYHNEAEDPAAESTAVTTTVSGLNLPKIITRMNGCNVTANLPSWTIRNGVCVPYFAYNAQKGTCYEYGVFDLTWPLSLANQGQRLTLAMDVQNDAITIEAGATLELNGYQLTADAIFADGFINDNTNGTVDLIVENLFLAEGNPQMPLYDQGRGAYHLYDYGVKSAGKQENAANHRVTFGYRVCFSNADAYSLLTANVQSEQLALKVTLDCEGLTQPITYCFPASLVERYVTYKQNGSNPAFTLLVTGLDSLEENTKITTIPTLTSATGVAGRGAENYYL